MSALLFLAMVAAEPVVWTPVADPDPNFVAPKTKAARRASSPAKTNGNDLQEPKTLEGAFLNLEAAVEEAKQSAMQEQTDAVEAELKKAEESVAKAQAQVAEADKQPVSTPEE